MNLFKRREYKNRELTEAQSSNDPFEELKLWLNCAHTEEIPDYNAFHLGTTNLDGNITGRILLLKEVSPTGLIFFTHYTSRKGKQISENNKVSATFFWPTLDRQIRIEGLAEKLNDSANDTYFKSRPIESQVATVISKQSKHLKNRETIEEQFDTLIKSGLQIERPKTWGGYVILPNYFEFWQGRPHRLNDRIVYEKHNEKWIKQRLAP